MAEKNFERVIRNPQKAQKGKKRNEEPCCVRGIHDPGTKNGAQRDLMPDFDDVEAWEPWEISGTDSDAPDRLEEYPRHMVVRIAWRRDGSRAFVDKLKDYPGIRDRTDYRLLLSLLMTVRRGEPDQRIIIPWRAIGECMDLGWDVHRNYLRGDKSTGVVLKGFLERVLPDARLNKSHGGKGRARELVGVEEAIGDALLDARDHEFSRPGYTIEDRVYLDWTAPQYSPKQRSKSRDIRRRQARATRQYGAQLEHWAPPGLVDRLLDYVNDTLSARGFHIDQECFEEAYALVEEWPEGNPKTIARRRLRSLEGDAYPQYASSSNGGTLRIFTTSVSLASIDGDLRRILAPDWIELDLASAQLAIVSVDWDLPLLRRFLESGESIWESLYTHMDFEGVGISFTHAKPAIKRAMYSTAYGSAKKTALANMDEEYDNQLDHSVDAIPSRVAKRFFSHPLVEEVREAQKRRLQEIREAGGAHDCFDRWIKTSRYVRPESFKSRSVLAQLSQSRELQLLQPAIDLAISEAEKDEARYHIMLWQHDGFSLRVRDKDRAANYVNAFQEAVDNAASPYPTRLEVKYNPEWMSDE